jgi:hypothetical protein
VTCVTLTLESAAHQVKLAGGVRKQDLRSGDCVVVTTGNSRYTIWSISDGWYWVWGGWFDRHGTSPQKISINGCTWGGSAIARDMVAVLGLRLEFGNRVVTSRIRQVQVRRAQPGACWN